MESRPPPATDELFHLLSLVYESVARPAALTEGLGVLNRLLGATCTQLFTVSRADATIIRSEISAVEGNVEHANLQFMARWAAQDPRRQHLASLPAGTVLRCHKVFDDNFIAGNSFYQKFFLRQGLRWSVAAMFDSGNNTATVIAGMRAPHMPPFEEDFAAVLKQLLPHFEKAAKVRSSVSGDDPSRTAMVEMLKALPMPCIFIDTAGRCLERNNAFGEAAGLLSLHLTVGRVRFTRPRLQAIWEAALSELQLTAVPQTVALSALNGRPWRLHLIPLLAAMNAARVADQRMILAVFDERPLETQQGGAIQGANRLTAAELEVLAELLQGLPAKAIATHRGASVNTVRSQIMAILDKTGHSSQKGLIASFGASRFGASSFDSSTFAQSALGSGAVDY